MDQFSTVIEIPKAKNTKKPWWAKIAKAYVLLLILASVFILGIFFGFSSQPKKTETNIKYTADELKNIFAGNSDIDAELFSQVWEVIHSDYLDKENINDKDLFYGAISGMVNSLGDPHSSFFDPKLTKEFTRELDGIFYGIGAEIGMKKGYLVVISPLNDTPAFRAGLQPGDKILAIDAQDTSNMSVDQAVSLIRGDKGTAVVLTILVDGENATKDVSLVREKIDIPSVVYKLEDNIAIIEISSFNDDTDERFAKATQKAIADNPDGLIIDLRNNPGGFLLTAVDIAGYWLDKGQVVVRETFSDKRMDNNYEADSKFSLAGLKTVVLVNEGSASASEIVAGALQDYDLAEIVGQTTFGKGSVQQLIPLKDDSSVKLTVARWLTPNGRTIEGQGIMPDYMVEYLPADYENNIDPQLNKAKELIYQ